MNAIVTDRIIESRKAWCMKIANAGLLTTALSMTATALASEVGTKETSPPTPSEIGKINRDSSALTPPASFQGKQKNVFADRNPRLILVLGGGAGKAVAQIGVIRSLEKHKIPIDAVVGTSLGAMIGALYCAGMPLDEIEQLFLDKTVHRSIMSGVIRGIVLHPIMKLTYLATGKPYAGASTGTSYLRFLKQYLPKSFAELKKPFAAVSTNITDGQTCVFTSGNLPESVLASCSVPLMFRPVMIKGKLYVDGGLKANLPASIAQKLGDGVVVSVLCDNAIKSVPNNTFRSKSSLISRVADIMIAAADQGQAKDSDVLIYPNVDFVPAITKNIDVLKKAINAGEEAANVVIPKISAKLAALNRNTEKQVAKMPIEKKPQM